MMIDLPSIKTGEDFDKHFQSEIWRKVAKEICNRHQITFIQLERLSSSDHVVFAVDDSLILKIYRPFRNCYNREKSAIELIGNKVDIEIPEIVRTGEIYDLNYLVMTRLSGDHMTREDWLSFSEQEQISFAGKLASSLKQIHALDSSSCDSDWAEFVEDRAETFIERQISHGVNSKIVDALPRFMEENLKLLPTEYPTVFMHSDVHFGNLLVSKSNDEWEISGLFDFADSRCGFHEYDFLAVGVLIMQGQAKIQREFFKAYGYAENELDESFRKRLMMLTMLYETADLRRYAERLKPEAVDFTLDKLEKAIWSFA